MPTLLHMAMLERVCQRAPEFDFLHFHLDYYPFSLFARQPVPSVTTLHGRLDLNEHQTVFRTFPEAPVISISDAQRKPVPYAGWIRTSTMACPKICLHRGPDTGYGLSWPHLPGESAGHRDLASRGAAACR